MSAHVLLNLLNELQPSAKVSKHGGLAKYNTVKRISRCVVHHAGLKADKVVYVGIDHKSSDIFYLANQMRKENVDVVGDSPVKNDTGEM